jgi:hypothetical protein
MKILPVPGTAGAGPGAAGAWPAAASPAAVGVKSNIVEARTAERVDELQPFLDAQLLAGSIEAIGADQAAGECPAVVADDVEDQLTMADTVHGACHGAKDRRGLTPWHNHRQLSWRCVADETGRIGSVAS